MNLLTALLCLIYVLSPIDLLPEAILGPFGLPDDVIAIIIGARALFRNPADQSPEPANALNTE